jgi:hypothetical protein
MKKLFPIISVLCLVWSGSAFAKEILFSNCAAQYDNYEFRADMYERNDRLINTNKGVVTSITILQDKYINKLLKKNPNSGQPKYFSDESKIHSFNEFLVITKNKFKPVTFEHIYDLKQKKIQVRHIHEDKNRDDNVFLYQCK